MEKCVMCIHTNIYIYVYATNCKILNTWNKQVPSHCHSDLTSTLNSNLLQDPAGPCDKLQHVPHVQHV